MKKSLLALTAGILAVGNAYAMDWYLIGEFNNWDEEAAALMTEIGEDTYSITMDNLNGQFKFIGDRKWENNFGAFDVAEITGNGTVKCASYGTNFNANNLENVTITLNTKNSTVTFAGLPTDMAIESYCYIIGDASGGWKTNTGIQMEKVSEGVYEWTLYLDTNEYFGFASELAPTEDDWGFLNSHRYAAAPEGGDAILPTSGAELPLAYPKEGAFHVETSGTYKLTIDTNKMVVTCNAAEEIPQVWSIIGEFSNWSGDIDMTKNEDGLYEVKMEELEGEFKFRKDHAWATSRGAGDNPKITMVGEYECWDNGQNYYASEKLKNVKLVMDLANNKLTVSISTAAVKTIDRENETPVYFNLQGVKVENPEKGLYIKITSGKAEKVIL